MSQTDSRAPLRGIVMMAGAMAIFALQDGISRHLAAVANVYMVVMIRYWVFALFVVMLAARSPGGLGRAVRSGMPRVQALRAIVLVVEVLVMIQGFVILGLVESHAVFAAYPLMIAALSGPILGEHVGWRRWSAIGVGFAGVLVILQPGVRVFDPAALIPLAAALLFALYGLLTRYVARADDAMVSFFWTGTLGALAATAAGIWFLEPLAAVDWIWMALLCATSTAAHWMLIRAYEIAEASAIQPFAYLQLVFIALIGTTIFDETLRHELVVGAAMVVGAGLFTLWRARKRAEGP